MTINFSAGTTITSAWCNDVDTEVFQALSYGALGNGTTDDTTALQAAVDAAAAVGAGLDGRGLLYGVKNIRLKNGLRFFRNFRLKAVTAGQQSILELAGYTYSNAPVGAQTLATGMNIVDCDLDCNNIAPMAVFGQANTDILLEHLKISNVPNTASTNAGIQFNSTTYSTGAAPANIRIINCNLTMPTIAFGGFTIPGIYILGATETTVAASGASAVYQSTGSIPRANPVASHITIQGCTITGGYYGIATQGMDNSRITGCTITGQGSRAIQIIDSWYNSIDNNPKLTGWNISAINASFGSSHNVIHDNFVERTATLASDNYEGAVQSYVYVRENHIYNNRIITNGRYGIYVGVDASNCTVSANYVEGATVAQIAVEANWLNGQSPGVPAAALYSRTSSTPQSQTNMVGIKVINNRILPAVASCAIYYSCLATVSTITASEAVIANNTIYGTAAHYIYVVAVNAANASTNSISTTHVSDNLIHNGDLTVTRMYMNRTGNGRGCCSECRGNTILNHLPAHVNLPDLGTSPSVSDADEWVADYSGATNLSGITGGMIGQQISVHLKTNVTLKHNAAQSLKGGVDAVPPANPARGQVKLRYFDIWVEEYRNF